MFTSSREKRLWSYVLVVWGGIFASLFFGEPLAEIFSDQNWQAAVFLSSMLLIAITVLVHGVKTRPRSIDLVVWLGLIAVYLMVLLRLGLPERTHLIEYSVLALFMHRVLEERMGRDSRIWKPALLALGGTVLAGVADECLQLFLPDRVFDPVDIFFNSMAAFMAIGSLLVLKWTRRIFKKRGV